jgi:hypothetical protein
VVSGCNLRAAQPFTLFGTSNKKGKAMSIERETIVTDGGSGPGSGFLIGIVLVILVLLLVGGITVFNGGFSFGGHAVTVDIPKVTVTK